MRAVPEYDAKSWLLKALRETPNAIEALLWDLHDDELDRRPADDEWSCREIVMHMCAMERRYTDRLELIVRLDEPRIDAFDGDSIAAEDKPSGDETDVFEQMQEYDSLRRRSVYLLWSLDDRDWRRRGVHPYLGSMTLLDAVREMNEHDLSHIWQLRRLCDCWQLESVAADSESSAV